MKKLFSIFVFIAIAMTIQAQSVLYKGLKSGMPCSQVQKYLVDNNINHTKLNPSEIVFECNIKGVLYIVSANFNNNNHLSVLHFHSYNSYNKSEYNVNILSNMMGIYHLLKNHYGDPQKDVWYNYYEIPKGKDKNFVIFLKNNSIAILMVSEYKKNYNFNFLIADTNYMNLDKKDKSDE